MIAVPALVPPLTRPVVVTLAILGALLVQLPPAVASLKDTDEPVHIGDEPNIAPGAELTVATTVEDAAPHAFVTV